MRSHAFAIVVSVVLLALVAAPLVRDPRDDSFPLSTYPMFAYEPPRQLTIAYAIGLSARGERRYLAPYLIGSSEVLQARAILENAVARGPAAATRLCKEIAARVREVDDEVVAIRIVTGTHDPVAMLVRGELGVETERARCATLPRSGER